MTAVEVAAAGAWVLRKTRTNLMPMSVGNAQVDAQRPQGDAYRADGIDAGHRLNLRYEFHVFHQVFVPDHAEEIS